MKNLQYQLVGRISDPSTVEIGYQHQHFVVSIVIGHRDLVEGFAEIFSPSSILEIWANHSGQ